MVDFKVLLSFFLDFTYCIRLTNNTKETPDALYKVIWTF